MKHDIKLIANRDPVKATKTKRALTDKEASLYIGMGVSWLRHGRVTGDRFDRIHYPQFIKIGRSVRYLIEDLDRWIEQFKKFDHLSQFNTPSLEKTYKRKRCETI